jgi:aquaporin Z
MTLVATQPESIAVADPWRRNWQLYLIEGTLLGLFMISACGFVALIEHRSSPVRGAIGSPVLRRALIGLAMGATAIALIYSPWGKRSGAQMNPAMTLGFWRLGRLKSWDAAGYIGAQFIGGSSGVALMSVIFGSWVRDSSVNYVATRPGPFGPATVWLAEFTIALVMMTVVMAVNQLPKFAPYTGCFAGALVALYITFEAPISGMSLNPARTFASAINASQWAGWWIYFTAPVAGMFAGIELHRALGTPRHSLCGKLSHSRSVPCHIRCSCIDHQVTEERRS